MTTETPDSAYLIGFVFVAFSGFLVGIVAGYWLWH